MTLASHSPGVEDVIDPQLWFKYPVSVGDNWVHLIKSVTCLGTDSSVLVPAGTFTCINYQFVYSTKADLSQPGQSSTPSSPWFPPGFEGDSMLKASYILDTCPGIGNIRVSGDRGYTLQEYFLVE